jgi:uncharacterized protein
MGAEDNLKTIQLTYEAFGRGDVSTILEFLTDDVDWASQAASSSAPWFGAHDGKDAVARFFQEFGSTVEVAEFTPAAFAANETDVFSIVHFRGTVRSTGKEIATDLHHWFRFRDGKIYHYRGTEDTEQTANAVRG